MSHLLPSKEKKIRFESSTTILRVGNVPASTDYYVNVLGFKKDWIADPTTMASVSRDNASIMLSG